MLAGMVGQMEFMHLLPFLSPAFSLRPRGRFQVLISLQKHSRPNAVALEESTHSGPI